MSYHHQNAQQHYQYDSWEEDPGVEVMMHSEDPRCWAGHHAAAAAPAVDGFTAGGQPPLAAQWRFASRTLRRYAPEEKVHDPRQQLSCGDHVFVQYGFVWELAEQHGIVCSSAEESHSVIHWKGNQLYRVPLSQFAKGGELYRLPYPCWVAQAYLPMGSCGKPHVADQKYLEADNPETVTKQVMSAYRNSSWSPSWSQARDLEFCIAAKTGWRGIPWEVHTRKTLSSGIVCPIGCMVRGDCRPSQVLNGGAAAAQAIAATLGESVSQAPRAAGRQAGNQGMLSVSSLEAYQRDRYGSGVVSGDASVRGGGGGANNSTRGSALPAADAAHGGKKSAPPAWEAGNTAGSNAASGGGVAECCGGAATYSGYAGGYASADQSFASGAGGAVNACGSAYNDPYGHSGYAGDWYGASGRPTLAGSDGTGAYASQSCGWEGGSHMGGSGGGDGHAVGGTTMSADAQEFVPQAALAVAAAMSAAAAPAPAMAGGADVVYQ